MKEYKVIAVKAKAPYGSYEQECREAYNRALEEDKGSIMDTANIAAKHRMLYGNGCITWNGLLEKLWDCEKINIPGGVLGINEYGLINEYTALNRYSITGGRGFKYGIPVYSYGCYTQNPYMVKAESMAFLNFMLDFIELNASQMQYRNGSEKRTEVVITDSLLESCEIALKLVRLSLMGYIDITGDYSKEKLAEWYLKGIRDMMCRHEDKEYTYLLRSRKALTEPSEHECSEDEALVKHIKDSIEKDAGIEASYSVYKSASDVMVDMITECGLESINRSGSMCIENAEEFAWYYSKSSWKHMGDKSNNYFMSENAKERLSEIIGKTAASEADSMIRSHAEHVSRKLSLIGDMVITASVKGEVNKWMCSIGRLNEKTYIAHIGVSDMNSEGKLDILKNRCSTGTAAKFSIDCILKERGRTKMYLVYMEEYKFIQQLKELVSEGV